MAFRAVLILLTLVAGYILFEIGRVYVAYEALDNVPESHIIGPEDADVTVVEFLDYACPYCRQIHPTIMEAVKTDGNVRYIARPVTILNTDRSVDYAYYAYAGGLQGKFKELHELFITYDGPVDEALLDKLHNEGIIDLPKLAKDTERDDAINMVRNTTALFKTVGGRATPTFVISKRLFYVPEGRMPTVEDFLKMFNEIRGS